MKARQMISEVQEQLLTERGEILTALLSETQPTDELGGGWQEIDSPSERAIRDLEFSQREALQRRLRQLDDALDRLDDGTYGRCGDCGQPIGRKRLAADLATPRCLACQASLESAALSPGL